MAGPNGAPSLHAGLLAGFGAFAPSADVQVFTPISCSQAQPAGTAGQNLLDSWNKPKGAQFALVIAQGPGGGGGSGRKGSTSTVCCGGGGGASGNLAFVFFSAADLPDELLLFVPCGGVGGAGVTVNDTSGNNGASGGPTAGGSVKGTFFGIPGLASFNNPSMNPIICAASGGSGSGGTAASGSGGTFVGNNGTFLGTNAGTASSSGAAGTNGSANPGGGATGGGSGGGLTSGNTHSGGGGGGALALTFFNSIATSNAAANGLNGVNSLLNYFQQNGHVSSNDLGWPAPQGFVLPGSGGQGGGSASSGDAASGGNGGNGLWGGGGGGGGAATDTTSPQSGAGGNGGDGFIIVVSW